MSDPLAEVIALRGARPLPAIQERALVALREAIEADAIFLASSQPTLRLLCGASPSSEILENLFKTAAPLLAAAERGKVISKKFTFRDQSVQMVAESCGSEAVWLVAWVRSSGPALASLSQIIRLAAQCMPVGDSGPEATAQTALTLVTSLAKPRVTRLRDFAVHTRSLLGCQTIFIARRTLRGWIIPAVDPTPLPAPRSTLHEALLLALTHLGATEHATVFPPTDSHPALAEIARLTESASCAVLPAADGWALVAVWSGPSLSAADLEDAIRPLTPLLPVLDRHSRSLFARWKTLALPRRRLWSFVALSLVLLLLFPFRLRVHAPAVLEPSLRRFVAVPFDSILKKVHVAAGDLVQTDSLLADLDGSELRERMAEIESQVAAASLQSASDLADSRFGESSLSALQAQRAGHELEVLREREKNLKILAPIAGVVLQGDLDRQEGAALKLGHSIMEIAPLDTMVVEIALREGDVSYVRPGQSVSLRLNALPSLSLRTTITKINPRAETRDGRNVFVAEAKIANPDQNFRPGMKGDSVVVTVRRPLFWILFRKPWNVVRGWLFW